VIDTAPPPRPPVVERPAAYQVSYGAVEGVAEPGTKRVVVRVDGKIVREVALRGRSFSLGVALPPREVRVRVETVDGDGHRAGRTVLHVLGLPPAARPVVRPLRLDRGLERNLRRLVDGYPGSAAVYVEDLATGAGAAWNARATFPAASTLKLAIAVTILSRLEGPPPRGSELDGLLRQMLIPSDNAAANALLVRLGGSTSGGGALVNETMRAIGLERTEMYGGYILGTALGGSRELAGGGVPLSVVSQPYWGIGKSTTALDLAQLFRAVWLSSGGLGPLTRAGSGVTPAEARYLLYVLARVGDRGKLARTVGALPGVLVMHKAGWIDAARHDAGLVVWRGGVLVAAAMTYRPSGTGTREDAFAGRVAATALRRFRG
jgi:beta-lactamase class A